jgi:NAD(P)-dependent dehydrogenase (short-subunit alcohol dehydrogenase family)
MGRDQPGFGHLAATGPRLLGQPLPYLGPTGIVLARQLEVHGRALLFRPFPRLTLPSTLHLAAPAPFGQVRTLPATFGAMADLGYDGKVAIITGAGGGLGREHALLLASRGAQVVINDLGGSVSGEGGSEGPAKTTAKEIEDLGGVAVADTNTVATPEGGEAIVKTALDAFGRVDILINNAGILRDKTFHNMTADFLNPVLDVHLKGAFYVTRPAWIKMREQNYGRVLNTSSNSGILGNFGQSNYGAAKMGLVGFTRVLASEGAKYNIKVNAIAPIARTRMTEDILGPLADKLDPALVSPVAAWLVHEDCPVTGEIYSAGAGRIARFFIGLTEGYYDAKLTLEAVRDNFDQIRDERGYIVPRGPADEFAQLLKLFSD